jgi:hypothetical protein
MLRPVSAHELADHARCPRAWWFERTHQFANLSVVDLEDLLARRRAALGKQAARDPEVAVLERLLQRHSRFTRGIAAHQADAVLQPRAPWSRPSLVLVAALVLLVVAVLLLWR